MPNEQDTETYNWFVSFTQSLLVKVMKLTLHLARIASTARVPWCWLVRPLVWLLWIPTWVLCWICGVSIADEESSDG